jgi:hypothetical protein
MDGRRFDAWTAALAGHPGSRRAVAGIAAVGALAAVLDRLGIEATGACEVACAGRLACVAGVCDCTPIRGLCGSDGECCGRNSGRALCEQDRRECALFQPPTRVCCSPFLAACRNDCDCCLPDRCVDVGGVTGRCEPP